MIKPLIISRPCCFDQSPTGECLRTFLGSMDNDEWELKVYASDRKPLIKPVPEYAKLTHEKAIVQYAAAAVRRLLVPDLTWLPGYEWPGWGKGAVKEILKDMKKGDLTPDFIHSISFPVASHWAALQVKKATGLPWVMQFYDPWAENPYRPFKTKWLKKYDWAMERQAVEVADIIIHDNETIADMWRVRYGEEIGRKIFVLPLTGPLPKDEVPPLNYSGERPLTIMHIGNFLLNRTAKPFINAITHLLQNHPEVRNCLKVVFVGMVTESDKELIKINNLSDLFDLKGTLPATECVKYYQKSDLFLAVDGVNKDNFFFPSKILKYFYFQRPILGISPAGSVLHDELHRSRHAVYDCNDIDGIASFLYKAISDYDSVLGFDKNYWHRFEPKNVVSQYKELVRGFKSSKS